MFVTWLTFQKEDEKFLQDIINELAKKYNSIPFKPHITGYRLINMELDKISIICENICNRFQPFSVEFLNILYSNNIWKTLFVNLKTSIVMNEIHNNFKNEFQKIETNVLDSHISLIYKNMPSNDKKEIIKNLKLKKQFKINSISILDYSNKIENWKIVKKFILKG
jgi:hypothetical protein